MKPEDVPDELIEAASTKEEIGTVVWPHELRTILAAVLSDHEQQLRSQLDAFKAAIERARMLAAEAMKWAGIGRDYVDADRLLTALAVPESHEDTTADPLYAAIECVLLDYAHGIPAAGPDPNLSELAYAYQRRTGWTVDQPTIPDAPKGGEE